MTRRTTEERVGNAGLILACLCLLVGCPVLLVRLLARMGCMLLASLLYVALAAPVCAAAVLGVIMALHDSSLSAGLVVCLGMLAGLSLCVVAGLIYKPLVTIH